MPYTLTDYGADITRTIKAKGVSGLTELAEKLGALLNNPAFVAEAFAGDHLPPKRTLWHDRETDVYVLAHVQPGGHAGRPHSHGRSWAIYGTARGVTDMTEWRRVNPGSDEHAELVQTEAYRLGPGETRAYGPHIIHATAHSEPSWVIRVTGTDLDALPRYRFHPQKDKILEQA